LLSSISPVSVSSYLSPLIPLCLSSSDYSSSSLVISRNTRKSVSFYHTAYVILIPSVKEYVEAKLIEKLWWKNEDFHDFKVETAKEITEFIQSLPPASSSSSLSSSSSKFVDRKTGMKLYFQNLSSSDDELESFYTSPSTLTLTGVSSFSSSSASSDKSNEKKEKLAVANHLEHFHLYHSISATKNISGSGTVARKEQKDAEVEEESDDTATVSSRSSSFCSVDGDASSLSSSSFSSISPALPPFPRFLLTVGEFLSFFSFQR
jgi:hypothetical protein